MTRHRRRRPWFRRPPPAASRLRYEDRLTGERLPEATHVPRGLR